MRAPLDYVTPRTQPRPTWAPVASVLLFVVGGGAMLLGGAFGFKAGQWFHASRTDPTWTWGPNSYLLGMATSFAYASLALVPTGVVLLLVGWRVWRVRRAGT